MIPWKSQVAMVWLYILDKSMTCHSHISATVATDSWQNWQCYQCKVSFIVSKTQTPFASANFSMKEWNPCILCLTHANCGYMQSQMLNFFTQGRERTPWTTHLMWAHGASLWESRQCWARNPTQLHQIGCALDEHGPPSPPWTDATVEVVGPFDTKNKK
jgi:hypothetical protein